MNTAERNRILQQSAGLIFALQEFLPVDDFTSYDAQTAQEGLMRIHNSSNDAYERDELVHTLENEVDDLQNELDELREEMDNAIKEREDENAELNRALLEREEVIDKLHKELDEKYEADELLRKHKELEIIATELQDELKKEKERNQKIFNDRAELYQVKKWKDKYVGRNGRCLFCGKDRYSTKRDKYGYCPLLRDCFTCEECGDERYARNFNTFNGEHKSLGDIIFEKHSRGGQYETDSDIRYEVDITLRNYDERYVSSALIDGDFEGRFSSPLDTADIINKWFVESISADRPKEIMKLLSYYRDELSICNDTHI